MSIDARKKSRRGRPEVDSEEVRARMERSLLDKLDAWIARQPEPQPSRPEAVRRILAETLGGTDTGSIPVEDLNASNDE